MQLALAQVRVLAGQRLASSVQALVDSSGSQRWQVAAALTSLSL